MLRRETVTRIGVVCRSSCGEGLPMSVYSIMYDRELVLEFVLVFSRFEYSLKRQGFLTKNQKYAEADWDSFAVSGRGGFSELSWMDFKGARSALLSRPPKKQIVFPDGKLGWAESKRGPAEREEEFLVRLVRTI